MDKFQMFFMSGTLFLLFIIKTVVAFVPTSRYSQSSVIIKTKIYYLGGIDLTGKGANSLFYLDVSSPFDSTNPKWTDLTSVAPIPVNSAFAPSCVGGSNNSTIFLFEHHKTNNDNSTSLVTFTFDSTSQKWSAPTTSGIIPPTRQEMRAIVDKNGKIYINGGYEPYISMKSYNNTYILDSLSLSWANGPNALIVRSDYSATLLSSGVIVYIGGTNDDRSPEIDMNSLSIYDTKIGAWSSMTATGDVIAARQSHSAVLNKNGSIIIYGGGANNYTVAPNPPLAILDTNSVPYKWSAKPFTSTVAPPPLAYHSAQMVGEYMIIAFGVGILNAKFDLATAPNNNIFILDTTNYTWVTSIVSPNPSVNGSINLIPTNTNSNSNSNTNSNNSSNNSPLIIPLIAGLGSLLGVFIIVASIIGIVFCCKRKRPDYMYYIPTPGTIRNEM